MFLNVFFLWLFYTNSISAVYTHNSASADRDRASTSQQQSSSDDALDPNRYDILQGIRIEAQDTYYGRGVDGSKAQCIFDQRQFNQKEYRRNARLYPTGAVLTIRMTMDDLIKYKWRLQIEAETVKTPVYTLDFDHAMSDRHISSEVSRINGIASLNDWLRCIDESEKEAVQWFQSLDSQSRTLETQRLLYVPFFLEREMHKRYVRKDEKFDLPSDKEQLFVVRWPAWGVWGTSDPLYARLVRSDRPGMTYDDQASVLAMHGSYHTGWIMTSDLKRR